MALHSITPTINPTNVAYDQMQRKTASDNESWYDIKQKEEEAKRQRKQDKIDTVNNILKMAGSAIDLYSKYQSINKKELDEKNAELDYGLKTVQLQNALTKTSMAAQDIKDKAEIGENISTLINKEDSNGLYKYLMSNISKLDKNPSMVQAAAAYLSSKGFSEDDLEFIKNTGLTANQIQQSVDRRLRIDAINKNRKVELTPEQKANEKFEKDTREKGLNALSTALASPNNSKLASMLTTKSLNGNFDQTDPDSIDNFFKNEYKCQWEANWLPELKKVQEGELDEAFGLTKESLDPLSGEGLTSMYEAGKKHSGTPLDFVTDINIQGILTCTPRTNKGEAFSVPITNKETADALTQVIRRSNKLEGLGYTPINANASETEISTGRDFNTSVDGSPSVSTAPTPGTTPYKPNTKDAKIVVDNLIKKYTNLDNYMDASVVNDSQALDSVVQIELDGLQTDGYLRSLITPTLKSILSELSSKDASDLREYLKTMNPDNQRAVGRILLKGIARKESPKKIKQDIKTFLKDYVDLSDDNTSPSITPSASPSVTPSALLSVTPSDTPPVSII